MKRRNPLMFGKILLLILIAAAIVLASCAIPARNPDGALDIKRQPVISADPASDPDKNGYRMITSKEVRFTVRAPEANVADLYYQPATTNDRAVKLGKSDAKKNDEFTFSITPPADFNGEVWARVSYPDGKLQETEKLLFALSPEVSGLGNELPDDPHGDESERSDVFTGGHIVKGDLKPSDPNVRISVNVPAFELTLWQDDHEVSQYFVGVGQRNFPIKIGIRTADKIILNPDWVPPDSEWVRASPGVEPYERIPADDPQNPLGKIKIPLGDAYLLHEAQGPKDIGNLVSHGCIRVLRDDLFALARQIDDARDLDVSAEDFTRALEGSDRKVIELAEQLIVDINYDTIVVEGGVLHIYPDVYRRGTNTVENLRKELENYNIDAEAIADETLQMMIDRADKKMQFAVSLEDIKRGTALENGKAEPVVPEMSDVEKKNKGSDREPKQR